MINALTCDNGGFLNRLSCSFTTPIRHWRKAREIQKYLLGVSKNSSPSDDKACFSFPLPHKEIVFPTAEDTFNSKLTPPWAEQVWGNITRSDGRIAIEYSGTTFGQASFSPRALTTLRLTHAVQYGLTLEKAKVLFPQ